MKRSKLKPNKIDRIARASVDINDHNIALANEISYKNEEPGNDRKTIFRRKNNSKRNTNSKTNQ